MNLLDTLDFVVKNFKLEGNTTIERAKYEFDFVVTNINRKYEMGCVLFVKHTYSRSFINEVNRKPKSFNLVLFDEQKGIAVFQSVRASTNKGYFIQLNKYLYNKSKQEHNKKHPTLI